MDDDQLRLMTKVARLYHEQGLRQPQIATKLRISQPRVSRLLKEAVTRGIVRTVVVPQAGVHTELEDEIERRFGLDEAIVADAQGESDEVISALGAAAAVYLETSLQGGEYLGISSWSASLVATVDAMRPRPRPVAEELVQLIGGVGHPTVQFQATRLASRLAQLTGATPRYLPAPGLVGTQAARAALEADDFMTEVQQAWTKLTTVLVGIGSLEPSPLLQSSGNAIAQSDQDRLRDLGAVGDVCLRFFDRDGKPVHSDLDRRVLGIDAEQLRLVPRRVGVAGGTRKLTAIRAALRGGWINVLVTDLGIATRLVEDAAGH